MELVVDANILLTQLTARLRILPASAYQREFAKASRLAPHREDTPYLALALHLRLPLWSNDTALKEQGTVPVCTTRELLTLLQEHSR